MVIFEVFLIPPLSDHSQIFDRNRFPKKLVWETSENLWKLQKPLKCEILTHHDRLESFNSFFIYYVLLISTIHPHELLIG